LYIQIKKKPGNNSLPNCVSGSMHQSKYQTTEVSLLPEATSFNQGNSSINDFTQL